MGDLWPNRITPQKKRTVAETLPGEILQSEAEVTVLWLCSIAMEANPSKFPGILFKGNKQANDLLADNIEFSKSMTSLGVCIDENLNFDFHIKDICLKTSRQICALQRLMGLLHFASRKEIYIV